LSTTIGNCQVLNITWKQKQISSKKVKMESEDDSSLSREMFQDSTQRSSTLRWATFDDLLDDALEEGKLSPTRFVNFRSLNYSNSILCWKGSHNKILIIRTSELDWTLNIFCDLFKIEKYLKFRSTYKLKISRSMKTKTFLVKEIFVSLQVQLLDCYNFLFS